MLGLFLLTDLLWFAHDRRVQCDPALDYPRLQILESLAQLPPGRVLGINCLPATLTQTHGLRDIRGYDAVDPARLMDLMALAADPSMVKPAYALTQWFVPQGTFSADGIQLSPVLNLLNVRYVIFRDSPPPNIPALLESPGYWVLANHDALPRAFIPHHVETVTNATERLKKLGSPQFDPRAVAYVEQPLNLPVATNGTVEIVDEIPTRVTLAVRLNTPGLVVLADLWEAGWQAYLNGQSTPILRADHALRGVVVPAGETTLEFRYEPASFRHGLQLAGLAAALLLLWFFISRRRLAAATREIGT